MKKMTAVIISLILTCGLAMPAAAQEGQGYTPEDKFSRGLFNTLTSALEIPITAFEISNEETPLMGLLYGVPVGVGKAIVRLCVGLVEFTTFPFPPYEPILEPETIFPKK